MPVSLRTWLRYVVPLTLLAALAFVPMLWLAWRVPAAPDLAKARAQVRLGWILAATAWVWQLWLVAGVAPAVRGLVAGRPLSQGRAVAEGLRGLARGAVPCTIAVLAIALGGVALVVLGVLLLVLLALTGASERLTAPPPAALADSVAVVRRNLARVAIVVGAIIAIDLAVCVVAQHVIVPAITGKIVAAKLVPLRAFLRALPLALAAISPLAACALAATYARLADRTS